MKITLSRSQWEGIGKKAGWIKEADAASDKVDVSALKKEIIDTVFVPYQQIQPTIQGLLKKDDRYVGNSSYLYKTLYHIYEYMRSALPQKYHYIMNDGAWARLVSALEAYFPATQGGVLNFGFDPKYANDERIQGMFVEALNAMKNVADAFTTWENTVKGWQA
jgi:hypothetical protein